MEGWAAHPPSPQSRSVRKWFGSGGAGWVLLGSVKPGPVTWQVRGRVTVQEAGVCSLRIPMTAASNYATHVNE